MLRATPAYPSRNTAMLRATPVHFYKSSCDPARKQLARNVQITPSKNAKNTKTQVPVTKSIITKGVSKGFFN
jgi:hypothetical protein